MTHPGENQTFAADARRVGTRVVALGLGAIAALLLLGGVVLFLTLPDAGVFNDRVERLFVENDTLTGEAELKLLEILAQSGTAFAETLAGYRIVIFVLLVFATALLIAALGRQNGHASEAAKALKLPRKTFYDKLARYGIRPEDFRR